MDHHLAQATLGRMLFDADFARAVRSDPASEGVPADVAALLARVDDRALYADPLRRRRTLGALVEEYRVTTAIVVAERRSLAFLESYFSSREFHREMARRGSMALGYGAFVIAACADGRLVTPRLSDVARLEWMQARARRESVTQSVSLAVTATTTVDAPPNRLRLAPGVVYARLGGDVLDTIARVERHQLELSIVPGAALCVDAPRLELPPLSDGIAPLDLLVVPTSSGLSVVTLDEETAAVIAPLGAPLGAEHPALDRAALVRAAVQQGLTVARAEALVLELLGDEILTPAG